MEESMDYWNVIKSTMKFIDEKIADDLSVAVIAAKAGYSEYHFCRVFKEYTGMSLMDYARRRKLIHAILDEDKNLLEAAYDYGFQTQTGFIKAFKRIYNITPSQYRMNVLKTLPNGQRMVIFERIGKLKMNINVVNDNVLEKALAVADKMFNLTANGTGKYSYAFWKDNFLKNPELMIIAEDEKGIVGLFFGWARDNTVTLSYDWIEEKNGNDGLKETLLKHFEKKVTSLGYSRIALGVQEENEEFYLRNGYSGFLLAQSETIPLDKIAAVADGYEILSKHVYEGTVNQVKIAIDANSKTILKNKYLEELPGCNTIMVYWRDV